MDISNNRNIVGDRDEGISSEAAHMEYYIRKVREINEEKYRKTEKKSLVKCVTFGCQMNAHDSEKIEGMFLQMGYAMAETEQQADVILYNTCCVRENAENKVYGNLGYLKNMKEKKPELTIIVCGCMMQQKTVIEKIKKTYRNVDIIFGTFNLHHFPQLLCTHIETGETIIDVWEEHREILEDLPAVRNNPYKASVNIMYGCNNFCSYCIVPYVRGRERSREASDIVTEVQTLVADGVKEIMLLGQNVNSYGKTLQPPVSFAELLRKLDTVEGLERIRFMTSHPKDLSDDLIYAIRDCDTIGKHLHLPFQSGSTKILTEMNRRYTKESYLALIQKIKQEIPNILLTTDIIVGFPGESEEDFADTLDVVKQVRFSSAFTFIYSKRTGTPAANLDNQISESDIKRRFDALVSELNTISHEINTSLIGSTQKVLVEEQNSHDQQLLTGRSDSNCIVHFKGGSELIGSVVAVKITNCKTFYLLGELAKD